MKHQERKHILNIAAFIKKRIKPYLGSAEAFPTLLHITHPKAGSQWIRQILHQCAPRKIITPQADFSQYLTKKILPGKIYPALYLTYEQTHSVTPPCDWIYFVVIRDLRDTLISYYYSMKFSHPLLNDSMAIHRKNLTETDNLEKNMAYVLDILAPGVAAIQQSWLNSKAHILRYEDLLVNDVGLLMPLLKKLPLSEKQIAKRIISCRFEKSAGRKQGKEDVYSHHRKGIAGDWKNHFNENTKKIFKEKYGDLLIKSGYEKDNNW